MNSIRIGTRGSRLALWQAQYVADLLRPLAKPRAVEMAHDDRQGDPADDCRRRQLAQPAQGLAAGEGEKRRGRAEICVRCRG